MGHLLPLFRALALAPGLPYDLFTARNPRNSDPRLERVRQRIAARLEPLRLLHQKDVGLEFVDQRDLRLRRGGIQPVTTAEQGVLGPLASCLCHARAAAGGPDTWVAAPSASAFKQPTRT
jgi:hypothetical protein